MEPAQTGNPAPRAFLRVGGETLARHQLALALAAGCTRIACLAHGMVPELIELQHAAEKGGATFHIVAAPHGLSPLVSAADELLVIAEGLLPVPADALGLIGQGQAVLVQPAETGIPAGFERIDINHAWAGLMLLPGRLVERLMVLPPDADPVSALLRIALHSGTALRTLPEGAGHERRWRLVRTEEEAQAAEDELMQRHTAAIALTPGPVLARLLVRRFGSALLHENRSNTVIAALSSLLVAIGLALAWFGHALPALALAGCGWVLRQSAALLERVREQMQAGSVRQNWRELAFSIAFDFALGAMLVMAIAPLPGQFVPERMFAPAMLIGLLRLLPRGLPSVITIWADDRLALCLLLAAMAAGSVLGPGVAALSALLLFTGLLLTRAPGNGQDRAAGLTPA